ncbi:hypothetical protein K439DRAFT_1616425 [Ramaria rubella]|nr:hypothetical protein K439DRAFT_1616425 [Ramaria rubella]
MSANASLPMTIQPTLEALGVNLNTSLGAILAGVLISTCLYGTIVTQAYNYFLNSWRNDPLWLRLFVITFCFLETGHTVFICHAIYDSLVTNWGVVTSLNDLPWTLKSTILWSSFVGLCLQLFLANRIRIISRRWEIFTFIHLLVWVRVALGIFVTIKDLENHNLEEFQAKYLWCFTSLMVLIVVTDSTNAIALSYYLSSNRSGIKQTDMIVNRMIMFSIESGILTSVCTIIMLIFFLSMKNKAIWLAVFVIIAKNYSNSILISLNSRSSYRNAGRTRQSTAGTSNSNGGIQVDPLQSVKFSNSATSSGMRGGISVTTATVTDSITVGFKEEGDYDGNYSLTKFGSAV